MYAFRALITKTLPPSKVIGTRRLGQSRHKFAIKCKFDCVMGPLVIAASKDLSSGLYPPNVIPLSTDSSSSSILNDIVEIDLSISKILILLLTVVDRLLSAVHTVLWFFRSPLAHSSSQYTSALHLEQTMSME